MGLFFSLCFALITAELRLLVYHPVTQGSETTLPQHLSSVCVCSALQSSLAATYYREKQKCAKHTLAVLPLYLQSILHHSGYRNNNCTNEKFLLERRLSSTCCKISVPVVPLYTLLHEQVDHGAELFPLRNWICREAHAAAGMSVLSKSAMWGSGKCGVLERAFSS